MKKSDRCGKSLQADPLLLSAQINAGLHFQHVMFWIILCAFKKTPAYLNKPEFHYGIIVFPPQTRRYIRPV